MRPQVWIIGGMTYEQIISFFGGVTAARNALGLNSRQTIYNWKTKGVPIEQQLNAEVKSGGALRAEIPAEVRG